MHCGADPRLLAAVLELGLSTNAVGGTAEYGRDWGRVIKIFSPWSVNLVDLGM